jgi:hypothetical protein|tara:strand:+ start:872 stop:1627 length:756 start_codon:yes stop_codon:yes gene_type:complete
MTIQSNLRCWGKTGNLPDVQLGDDGSNPSHRISLELVENSTQKFNFEQIVKNHHTYKPSVDLVGRRIDWLIKSDGKYIGAIGVGSSVMAMKPRDDFIGWNKELRLKNLVKTCTNWRYCLIDKTTFSSKILKMFCKEARKEWKKKYGDNLVLIETLVEPPYEGICYKSNGWILVGKTKGFQYEWKDKKDVLPTDSVTQKFMKFGKKIDENTWKVVVKDKTKQKLIFVKPLHRYWKRELMKLPQEMGVKKDEN